MSNEIIQLQMVILEEKIRLLKTVKDLGHLSMSDDQTLVRIKTLQFVLDKMAEMGMGY
jgi:hypothetical protein